MKKYICFILLILVVVLINSCGGGDDSEANPSLSDEGTIINLKDGGHVFNGKSGVYFPPQDKNLSIDVTISGTGSSKEDPLEVNIRSVGDKTGDAKVIKSEDVNNYGIIFNPVLSGNSTQTPGSFGSINYYVNSDEGVLYNCTGTTPGSASIADAAIIVRGVQYYGCVEVEMIDDFMASFYLDSDSADETIDDLTANIRVLDSLCEDLDCGELAEPIDMPRLYSAYAGGAISGLVAYKAGRQQMYSEEPRREAYELMLLELFTQTALWEDYQDKIEEFSGLSVGLPQWVNEVTDDVEEALQITEGGKNLIYFSADAVSTIREMALGWSKYATHKNTIARTDKYLGLLSLLVESGIKVERGVFEWMLYQILGAAFTEEYIYAFEEKILPSVKDQALKSAFDNVKTKLLGSDPSTGEGGLLCDDLQQLMTAMIDTGKEITMVILKVVLGKVVVEGLISTGIGAGATAAYGFPPSVIPIALATVVVSAFDDSMKFDMEKKILTALATHIHNYPYDFGSFSEDCPTTDEEETNLYIAQNMFYSARLFFSLIKNSYDRWLVSGQMAAGDVLAWLATTLGYEDENYIWTLPRAEELGNKETKYGAKAVKALEILFTCDDNSGEDDCECSSGDCCDGCNYRTSFYVCDTETEYDCAWGTSCGSDVGQRTRNLHCSGNSSWCNGIYGPWDPWSVAHGCSDTQVCSPTSLSCEAKSSCSSCTHECDVDQTRCTWGRLYTCTTNSSGCRVWDSGTLCSTRTCTSDGLRCEGCTPGDHNGCYDNDVYSFDSCGVRESLVYDCGDSEWTGSPYCRYGHVYQSYTERGCSDEYSDCVASSITKKKEDCGTAGCVSATCCSDNASYSCYSNDVYWYSSCDNRQGKKQECGSSGYTGSDYCYSGDVYRDYVTRGCSSDHCTSSTERRLQDDCGSAGCSGGSCNSSGCSPHITWSNNTLSAEIFEVEGTRFGIILSWNRPSPNWVDHYEIARLEGSYYYAPPPSSVIDWSWAPAYVDTRVDSEQCYTYAVYAYDACDNYRVSTPTIECY